MSAFQEKQYRIGELADSCGLSRDTLRYYEKRGLLLPKKGQNQYRYYSGDDFSRLISLTWQRRMDIGLDDMERLSASGDYIREMDDIIGERLAEEARQLWLHRQTVARLTQQQADCRDVKQNLGKVTLRDFPASYVIVPETDLQHDSQVYLEYSHQHSGLDMMYAFDEYRLTKETGAGQDSAAYEKTSWLLFENLSRYTDYPLKQLTHIRPFPCLFLVLRAPARVPDVSLFAPLFKAADELGVRTAGRFLLSPMLTRSAPEPADCYLRAWLPLGPPSGQRS